MHTLQITAGVGERADGSAIPNLGARLHRCRAILAGAFGGYTELNSQGGWVNPEGRLVEEPGKTWQTAIATDAELHRVDEVGAQIKDLLQQHSLFMVLDGQARFY